MNVNKTNVLILLLLGTLALSACNEQVSPIPRQITDTQNPPPKPTPDINIKLDLPIYLDGVPSLLHPVAVSSVDRYADKSFSGEKISSYIDVSHYTLSGQMFNLVFENMHTNQTKPLFKDNAQLIYQADYPVRTLSEKTDTEPAKYKFYGHFIYQVKETLAKDNDDLAVVNQRALYLSDNKGDGLKKLHPDGEYVLETRWLPSVERYYFSTKSDSNGDGKITLADKSHNYYVDLADASNPVVKPYDFMPK